MPQYLIYKGRKCGSTARGVGSWTKDELINEAKLYNISTTGTMTDICQRLLSRNARGKNGQEVEKKARQEVERKVRQQKQEAEKIRQQVEKQARQEVERKARQEGEKKARQKVEKPILKNQIFIPKSDQYMIDDEAVFKYDVIIKEKGRQINWTERDVYQILARNPVYVLKFLATHLLGLKGVSKMRKYEIIGMIEDMIVFEK